VNFVLNDELDPDFVGFYCVVGEEGVFAYLEKGLERLGKELFCLFKLIRRLDYGEAFVLSLVLVKFIAEVLFSLPNGRVLARGKFLSRYFTIIFCQPLQ